jgi:hypothetical protein
MIIKRWNGSSYVEEYPKTTVGMIVASGTPSSSTYLRGDGTWSTPAGGVTGTGTTSTITYWDGTSSIASLSTATYPSLTELSYVKGVSSAIQTQLNGKQASLGYTPLNIAGGTMTGILYPQQNTSYTTGQARRIILSTGNPSGGGNGDVWIKYTA